MHYIYGIPVPVPTPTVFIKKELTKDVRYVIILDMSVLIKNVHRQQSMEEYSKHAVPVSGHEKSGTGTSTLECQFF